MAKRPDISIILLNNRQAYRADFQKSASLPLFQMTESVDAEASLADALAVVVDGQPRLSPRTIVLSTDVWSQIISLPRISISGIEADDLFAALRFEAETLSGIEIDNIALAYRTLGPVDDFDQFWISVIRNSDLDAINGYLQQKGSRDIVLAHPAGLSSLSSTSDAGLSAEMWGELVYLMAANGTRLSAVKQASGEVLRDCSRVLVGTLPRNLEPADLPQAVIRLADAEALEHWASSVANNYLRRLDQIIAPLLRKSRPRSGTPVRHLMSGVIALVVVGFCVWHYNYMQRHNAELVSQIAAVKQPALDKKMYDAQVVKILEDRAAFDLESAKLADELSKIQFFLDSQNDRIAKLLRLLIEIRKDDLVIQRIEGTEQGLLLSGVSLSGESAQALAKRLRESALPMGWKVNPAEQKGQEKLTTGGPWDFKISLTDVGPYDKAGG